MHRCPRCGRPVDTEITILRDTGVERAFGHYGEGGIVDMCHSDELALPRPYAYDEASQTVYRISEVRGPSEQV